MDQKPDKTGIKGRSMMLHFGPSLGGSHSQASEALLRKPFCAPPSFISTRVTWKRIPTYFSPNTPSYGEALGFFIGTVRPEFKSLIAGVAMSE